MNRTEELKKIQHEVFNLTRSPLYEYRMANKYLPVLGEGSHEARVMMIGEAPGRNEAKTGRPFCGAAGKILDDLLTSISLKRQNVYITNIVKDRPQKNRDPLPEEIVLYGPFLDRQIAIIQPRIIVALGRYSMQYLMTKLGLGSMIEPISVAHGKVYEGHTSYGTISCVPLYHPAASIYNPALKETLKKDFAVVKALCDTIESE